MKKIIKIILLLSLTAPLTSIAADIVNGWSIHTTITKIYSENSRTLFKLSNVNDGCGHTDWWGLSTEETASSQAKLSMLLSVYMANKTVIIRCENSKISDFEVSN